MITTRKTKMKLSDYLQRGKNRTEMALGLLFVLPAALFCILFDWYPTIDGIIMAFYDWNGYDAPIFVGIQNFIDLFAHDELFLKSMKNMSIFVIGGLVLMFPTIIASVVLFRVRNSKAKYVYRVLFCIPMVIPFIVGLLMWQYIYNPQFGFLNQLLKQIGLESLRGVWLGDADLAIWSLLFMGFPWVTTGAVLIYIGGLQGVDSAIWEVSQLDGVGPVKKFFALEFPLILGQFKLNLIGAITAGVTGYTLQMIMTNGGPAFSTLVPGLYMYQLAFKSHRYGDAAAISIVLFAVSLLLSWVSIKFIKSKED
ncbi:carbohydrate ABC transporter permease [Paenibacillus silvisoli]|uniref:carbohydrate ABC transporter permease n=1 Tax=Paenibacillus silvisoli TaxID=3110539 RepID=UPI002803E97A|nr:sugar ABC transporter permease [Paenibacillus silvisoli]